MHSPEKISEQSRRILADSTATQKKKKQKSAILAWRAERHNDEPDSKGRTVTRG